MGNPRVVFLCANEPVPTITRKLDLLDNSEKFDAFLVYWHRLNSLITMPINTDISQRKIHVVNLPEPRGNLLRQLFLYILFFLKANQTIRRLKPSVIHANDMDMLFVALLIQLTGCRCKLVLDLENTREIFIRNPFKVIFQWAIKRTSQIFITSPGYLDNYLKKIDPNADHKVLYVPNAPRNIDFKGFIRKKDPECLHVGYFGFLRGEETIGKLIDTAKKLNQEGLNVKIIFAGVGVCKPLVTKMAQQYDFIEYKGPFNYKENIKKLYGNVDIIFSMYYLDHNKRIHMSCRYSEAIVCNLPIIVQDGSFMAGLVRRDENGYVLKLGEWDNLYKLLKHLYFNREELERIGQNCDKIKPANLFDNYENSILSAFTSIAYGKSC